MNYNNENNDQLKARLLKGTQRLLPESLEDVSTVLDLAEKLHKGQKRRDNDGKRIDYIGHPVRVAVRILEDFSIDDPEVILAALLHDTVEDRASKAVGLLGLYDDVIESYEGASVAQSKLLGYYRENISARVSRAVDNLSNYGDNRKLEKSERISQYSNYVEGLVDNSSDDPIALVIKISDYVDNAGNLSDSAQNSKREVIEYLSAKYRAVYPVLVDAVDVISENYGKDIEKNVLASLVKVKESLDAVDDLLKE